jgi:transposase-like protein
MPAFKLAAVSRMSEGENVQALAEELGVRAELLYDWHRRYRSGGAEALRPMGRPTLGEPGFEAPLALASRSAETEQRRIEDLERKIGQQQLDLDFFRAALRHVGGQRRKNGAPGGTGSTR